MEAAAAAVPSTGTAGNDNLETLTVAEPEMEVEVPASAGELEPDDEIPEFEEFPEDVSNETLEERQPILLAGRKSVVNPNLLGAQTAMLPPSYPDKGPGYCVDPSRPACAYIAYCLLRTMYIIWPTTSAWLHMPYEPMQERFRNGGRYDVLGGWPARLCTVDPETNISREVNDEEIRTSGA